MIFLATLLLAVIYAAFIGLGIPDSLFGTAWPAIYSDFNIPISFGSFVTVIISLGTIVSSLISAKIISKFGTSRVTAVSTLMTAAALLGFSVSPSIFFMCLFALPLGMGAGAVDVALNDYVSLHYSATHMSFLHCFYGVGVSVSPYIMSLVIGGKYGWRGGYLIAFFIQGALSLLLFCTLPVWKKVRGNEHYESRKEAALSLKSTLKIPGAAQMCLLFICTCAIEWSCGGWGSTFLVEHKHLSAELAARIIMLFYIGMALGRFLSGMLAAKLHSWTIIKFSQILLGVALALFFIPGRWEISAAALFLAGLSNGPLFPNFNFLTPESFGNGVSRSVMSAQMGAAYVGILFVPALCGAVGQAFGMGSFPYFILFFYIIMVPLTVFTKRLIQKNKEKHHDKAADI